jgi:hypothetical protein
VGTGGVTRPTGHTASGVSARRPEGHLIEFMIYPDESKERARVC